MLAFAPVLAQEPSLDDLERRLDAAKKAESDKQDAARRAAAARAAQEARQARLVLEADAACEVRIDGERKATLEPGVISTIGVLPGQQLIDCVSTEFPEIKVREIREVQARAKLVVNLSLASQIHLARAQASDIRQMGVSRTDPNIEKDNPFGIVVGDISAEQRRELGLKQDEGAIVLQVTEETSASILRERDIVLMVGRVAIKSAADFQSIVEELNSSRVEMLLIRRDGETRFVSLKPRNPRHSE